MFFFAFFLLINSIDLQDSNSSIHNYQIIQGKFIKSIEDNLRMVESFKCVKFILHVKPDLLCEEEDSIWVSVNIIVENQHFVIEKQIITLEDDTLRLIVNQDYEDVIRNNPFYISFVTKRKKVFQLVHSNLKSLSSAVLSNKNKENNFKLDSEYIFLKNYLLYILKTFNLKTLSKSRTEFIYPLIIIYSFKKPPNIVHEHERNIFLCFLAVLIHQEKTDKNFSKIKINYKNNEDTVIVIDDEHNQRIYGYDTIIDYINEKKNILRKELYKEIAYLTSIQGLKSSKWLENESFEILNIQEDKVGSNTVEIYKQKKSSALKYRNLFGKFSKKESKESNLNVEEDNLKFVLF